MSNIFKQFHDFQSRNVDHPSYEPLKQWILVLSPEEEKRRKRNEYAKEYYRRNKARLREQQKEYWRRKHVDGNHKGDIIWNQKRVYEFLLDQYRKWEDPARWTEIAKALWISENSVYTAIFHLTKRWYIGRWTYGRYLLLKFPEWEKFEKENEEIVYDDFKGAHNNPVWRNYIDELADKISWWLITQNKKMFEEILQLREENQKMKDTLENIKKAWIEHERNTDAYYKKWQNSYGDLDQIIMNR